MTREEAIDILIAYESDFNAKLMAIEALQTEAVDVNKAHEEEHLNIIDRIKESQYAIAKTQTVVGKMVESADAVEVVRCKDCKHYRKVTENYGICYERPNVITSQTPNDFCSYGERKGGDDE